MTSCRSQEVLNNELASLQQMSSEAEMSFKNVLLRTSTSGDFGQYRLHCEILAIGKKKLPVLVLVLGRPEPKPKR